MQLIVFIHFQRSIYLFLFFSFLQNYCGIEDGDNGNFRLTKNQQPNVPDLGVVGR